MKRTAMLVLVAACSTNPHDGPVIILPDAASPDAPVTTTLTTVVVDIAGTTPTLIEYRDGKGQWTVPEMVFMQRYELDVTNDYDLVVVCADGIGGFDAERLLATASDGPTMELGCNSGPAATGTTVTVNGQMNQPGTVWLDNSATSMTAPWTYHVDVPTGMHDLVATDNTRLVLRRGIDISVPSTEPVIDLDANSVALTPVPVSVTNVADDDTLTTETYLETQYELSQLAFVPGATAETLPSAMMQANDFQLSVTAASNDEYDRWAYAQQPSTGSLELLPRLSGVTCEIDADRTLATFSALPTVDEVDLYVTGTATQGQHVVATPAWIAATGSASIGFDTAIPSYQASWHIDPSAYGCDFSAQTNSLPGGGTGMFTSKPVAARSRPGSTPDVLGQSDAVALEDEEVGREAGRTEREVGLAEKQIGVLGVDLDDVIAQAARRIERLVAAAAVVQQHRVEVLVVARGRVDRVDLVEPEALGRGVDRLGMPAPVEHVADDGAVVAHHDSPLVAIEALDELLDPDHLRDRQHVEREMVDAAKLPADERIEIGCRAAHEHLLELVHRRLLEPERGAGRERWDRAWWRDVWKCGECGRCGHDRSLPALSIT